MRAFWLIAPVFLLLNTATAQSRSLYDSLALGPYQVGFQVKQTYDYARGYGTEQGRPMQIGIWYPAKTEDMVPGMPLSTYLHLYLMEEGEDRPTVEAEEENIKFWADMITQFGGASIEPDDLLQVSTVAVAEAPVATGKFPILVYGAGGQGTTFENSILCEYLASYGFVVAASPAVGSYAHKTTVDPAGLEAEARDMEFIIGQLNDFPGADLNRLGLMGWSWGGLAALLVQMRNPSVDAVLSLDGSIALHEDKIRQTAFFDLQRLRVPYMFMSARATLAELARFFDQIRYSNAYLLDFEAMMHSDFSSYGYIARRFASALDGAAERRRIGYKVVCWYAQRFFDAYLKGGTESERFLRSEPAQHGVPDSLLTITFKETLPLPPGQEAFFSIIQEEGVDQARKIYNAVREQDPEYKLFEAYEMLELAYGLFDEGGRPKEAIEALKLSLDTYPDYYQAYGHLGRLYEKQKDWKNALAYFSMAYGMAVGKERTSSIQKDLNWYGRKIERLKERLGSDN